jgi:ABC-2 type transport system ATP-binding protein
VLVTTHFMDEAENCDRLLLINQSETIAQGTPGDLRRDVAREGETLTLEEAFIRLIELQREEEQQAA